MKLSDTLIEVVKEEVIYQLSENEKHDEKYNRASEFHTKFIEKLLKKVEKYPHYSIAFLEKHIREEAEIFGHESDTTQLTPEEEGRIYSLVRSRHMLRIAQERISGK